MFLIRFPGLSAFSIVASLALGTSGCVSTFENGPERVYTDDQQIASLEPFLATPGQGYTKQQRNEFISARMYLIDLKYNAYFAKLTKERQLGTLASDMAVVGLGAATTVIPGAQTKAILGAATAALAGAKDAVDKDVLLEQTVQILQNQMETSRASIRTRITENMKKDVAYPDGPVSDPTTIYTLTQGLSDLEDYYRAGTLAGALEALSAAVGDKAQTQRDKQNHIDGSDDLEGASPGKTGVSPPR